MSRTDLARAELTVPLTDGGMAALSWLHDEATDVDVEYNSDTATVWVAAKPTTVERARGRPERLDTPPSMTT